MSATPCPQAHRRLEYFFALATRIACVLAWVAVAVYPILAILLSCYFDAV